MITTKSDFYIKLKTEDVFENQTFDLPEDTLNINVLKSCWLYFENCTFNCISLQFKNIKDENLRIEFNNCSFNCSIKFSDCTLGGIIFENTQTLKSLSISKLKLNDFTFSNGSETKKNKLCTNFNILNTEADYFTFKGIDHIEGCFNFIANKLSEKGKTSFQNSTITNVLFSHNLFFGFSSFRTMLFKTTPENSKPKGSAFEFPGFYKDTFSKVSFSESKFNSSIQFDNCDFLSTTWFENCTNSNNSFVKLIACEFKGFTLFNKSKINLFDIERCTFNKSSSFTDAEFNTLKLFEVKFIGGAYFDEMKINKVLDKSYLKDKSKILEWKRTLRAIKQELQKTENKIDFNTYRNYELAAHYEELNLFKNFKDTSILWATKWSSNFGNWFWSLGFTLLSGLFWYSILYGIENSNTLNPEKINTFIVGIFRFFLVTDFYNPLENDRTYLENGWSWLIFIIGKIFIAFGIYEMIQSFRKFKA